MDRNRISIIVQGMTLNAFVDVTNEKELIKEGKKVCHYSDGNIKIFSPNNKKCDYGMFLIEYEKKYYVSSNTMKYIIKDFYKKKIEPKSL